MQKKKVLKEDGRYLIYYCFKDKPTCCEEGKHQQQSREHMNGDSHDDQISEKNHIMKGSC